MVRIANSSRTRGCGALAQFPLWRNRSSTLFRERRTIRNKVEPLSDHVAQIGRVFALKPFECFSGALRPERPRVWVANRRNSRDSEQRKREDSFRIQFRSRAQ